MRKNLIFCYGVLKKFISFWFIGQISVNILQMKKKGTKQISMLIKRIKYKNSSE